MLQARKLQDYLMFLIRKMLRLFADTKVMLLIHKQFSSCLHPYKVHLTKTKFPFYKLIHVDINDAPPSSLMDSIASPTLEGVGVGEPSLACSTLGVEGCVGAPRWE
jgi:hypothetical protein